MVIDVMTPRNSQCHDTMGFMPNQPKTPVKSFRISEDLYRAALSKAKSEGKSLTDIVREALEHYVRA
ncbi:hypothetical protein ITJ64_11625 [Herbiconiux sp. VKM Ac-1786]|uniref:hypothetical protein n=1 Tax=Herbiconiux sp. VKM Ac-1786 TaxID=2783824 RepID=UPI00188D5EAB|nr:hypothetical protein [Herbiconiux sp. VKM Ac-1786]MBF4573169.1 hypothetical protein [Herbiconiux sp. VKM Ac-1786]